MMQNQPKHQKSLFPEVDVQTEEMIATPWSLILYNDDIHTFDEVVFQLIKALKCDQQTAEDLTLAVHLDGSAIVFEGDFSECFKINIVLTEIQLLTEIKG
jgi:ATP-dependent Clp protease adaptor protein ClpS